MQNNNKIGLGLIAEKALVTILKSIFRDSFIQHNDFRNYNNGIGKGTDIKIDRTFDIEVKNWRLYNKPYGHDIIQKGMVNRFQHSPCKNRIVFISFSNQKFSARDIKRYPDWKTKLPKNPRLRR